MKKPLILTLSLVALPVLFLSGCNDPNDIEFSAEMLVKYDCRPTGVYFDRREAGPITSGATQVRRYYVYSCKGSNIGKRISLTQLMGDKNETN